MKVSPADHLRAYVTPPRLNAQTLAIVALTVAVQVGAIALYLGATQGTPITPDATVNPPPQRSDPGVGIGLTGLVIVQSLVLAGAYYFWRKLPEWLRTWSARLLLVAIVGMYALVVSARFGNGAAAALVVAVAAYWIGDRLPLYWIVHNGLALAGATVGALLIGVYLDPLVVAIVMVALIAWDVLAVDLSSVMGLLTGASSSAKIPNYFIIPAALRIDFEAVREWVKGGGNRPEGVSGAIGVGDFAIPGALAVSAVVAGAGNAPYLLAAAALVGTCLAVPFMVGAASDSESGRPGLPWLNGGALAGYLLVAAALLV